jgi:hypothetical protein
MDKLHSSFIHGFSEHILYRAWLAMNARCYNKKSVKYKNYGGRGIKICPEWRSDKIAFIKWGLNNGWEKGLQIDRINNDGDYSPDNCRFVTGKINCRNKRDNTFINHNQFYGTIAEISEMTGINKDVLYSRISVYKWDTERAITTPVRIYKSKDQEKENEN